eukprot:492621_1
MSAKSKRKSKKGAHLHDTVDFLERSGAVPKDQYAEYLAFVLDLADKDREETAGYTSSKQWLDRVLLLRKKHKIHPRKAQIKKLYEEALKDGSIIETNISLEQYLQGRQSRSLSGVLVIATLMSPYPAYYDAKTGKVKQQRFSCAHNCYYCPNEPGMPRSYLSAEPAVSRAARVSFNAIDEFYARAHTLQKLGHDIDKIELLVLGGTFCQFPQQYQEEFLRDLFWSANTFYDGIPDFASKRPRKTLAEEIKIHETATKCRIVGITLETRPDTVSLETIRKFREYGATRIQLGVQHIDDGILKEINRGCYTEDTIRAVRLLKNSGYKIDIHLMPNLPGSNPEKDNKMFEDVLKGDLIQADQWKVYPCQTVDFSLIQKWYNEGTYKPYSLEKLMDVVIKMKSTVHPWIRLNRIFRSLPNEHITSGITMSNFRQHMYNKMCKHGLKCKCIRCREIGTHIRRGNADDLKVKLRQQQVVLKKRNYDSSGGREIFLSMETEDETVLLGFVRLRLPPMYIKPEDRAAEGMKPNEAFLGEFKKADDGSYGSEKEYADLIKTFPELYRAALVREAHVYGAKQQVKDTKGGRGAQERNQVRDVQNLTGQSKGYGKKMMAEAERVARDSGYSRVAVIAGVGTRLYYRLKLGYKSSGSYMVKDFTESDAGTSASRRGGTVGIINKLQKGQLMSGAAAAGMFSVALFVLSTFLSIVLALMLTTAAILWLDYLHFFAIDYYDPKSTQKVNRSLLNLSRIGLVLVNVAVLFKWFSAFLPHIEGVEMPAIVAELLVDSPSGGDSGNCFCRTYWSLSLVSYVTAFYILKLIYHKRMIIMVQNPIFGNDSGVQSMPLSVVALLLGQVFAFSLCQFLVLNYVQSYCTDEPRSTYDTGSPYGCHDSFAAVDTWFAICAILFDALLFCLFCNKWYSLMFILMEEIAISLLVQFVLVLIGMLSDVIDALFHMSLLYYNKSTPQNFDSFVGTPAFCLDCLIIAACLVLSFTASQKYVLRNDDLTEYYRYMQKVGYAL